MKKIILILSVLFSLTVNAQTLTPCTGTTCAQFSNSDLRQIFGILGQWLPATFTAVSTGSNVNVVSLPSNTTNLATSANQTIEQSTLTLIKQKLDTTNQTLRQVRTNVNHIHLGIDTINQSLRISNSKLDSINNKGKLIIITYTYNTASTNSVYAIGQAFSASVTPTVSVPNGDYEIVMVVLTPSAAVSSFGSGAGWSIYNNTITAQVDGSTYYPSQDDALKLVSFNNAIAGSPFVSGARLGTWTVGSGIIGNNIKVINSLLYIQLYWIAAGNPTANLRVVVQIYLKRLK